MPATPNDNVTIPGSGVLLHVLNTSGLPVPVQGDDDGAIETVGGGDVGGTVDQGTGAAVASSWSVRIANAGASAFITPIVAGDNVLADLRVGGSAVANGNPVPISDGGGVITVDGTVGISGSVPVTGTFFQATQPVSVASLPLPSGAATEAKQPSLGTAGVPSTNVITVQGIVGGIGLVVDTEMSAAVAAGPGMANPTAGGVISYGALYRSDTGLWARMEGNGSGLYIQGNTAVGAALNHNPSVVGGCNGTTVTRIQTDSTGRLTIVGAGTSGSPVGGVSSVQGTVTSQPAVTAAGLPVRVINRVNGALEIHAQTSAAITNAANKLLFGFTNNTGVDVYVSRVNLSNKQTATIAGVVGTITVQVGSGAIAGGTTVDAVSSPSLVAACFDVRNAVPGTLVFNTNGTLGGTVYTLENTNWSTDELSANGSGLASEIAAIGVYSDVFNFEGNPIVVPNGYSCGIVCDAALTNGQTLVDFNIQRA